MTTLFKKGVRWHTNSQGMRDRAYTVAKPPRTFRIALVGDSIGAGWGVDVDRRFESILERTGTLAPGPRAGWPSRSSTAPFRAILPGQRWCHFSQVGWPMNPDMVIYRIDRGRRRLG